MMENNCEGYIWHDSYTWACCNGDSEHRADFVNCGCEHKEKAWEDSTRELGVATWLIYQIVQGSCQVPVLVARHRIKKDT